MPHTNIELPEKLPIYRQKEMVPFPYMIFPLFVSEHDALIFTEANAYDNLVAVVLQKSDAQNIDQSAVFNEIGTLCRVNKINKIGDDKFKITLEGLNRLRILEVDSSGIVSLAHCEMVREFVEKSMVSDALVQSLNALLKISLSHGKPLPDDVMKMIDYIDNPARLSDLVALSVNLPLTELQELLETIDPLERLKMVYVHLTNEVQRIQVKNEVNTEVNRKVGKNQKEYILREQMKHIQEELGEEDPKTADMNDLRRLIDEAGLPADVKNIADKELQRLERINPASPEHNVSRTYLDYLAGMPWNKSTEDSLDMIKAEE